MSEIETITQSIRNQTEQNQVLRKLFSELEKELRSLTETRLELEIKLDYLNTASSASAVLNSGVQSSSIGINNVINVTPSITSASNSASIQAVASSSSSQVNVKKLPQSKSNNISSSGTPITISTSTTTPQISSLSNSNHQTQTLTTPVGTIPAASKI